MIYIVIPTYKRVQKLKKCIESIYNSTFKDWRIVVVADNNDAESVIYALSLKDDRIDVLVQPEHCFVIGAWNRFWKEYQDKEFEGMIGLCDDVELKSDCLEKAVTMFRQTFSDTDGVIGINQECPGHLDYTFKWFGQTVIGKKFASRYPDYQTCCPDYKHFYQDEEMWIYAEQLGKFKVCSEAVLLHYHPAFIKELKDDTHDIIRKGPKSPKNHDIATNNLRRQKGLVWGESFELINDNRPIQQ